MTLDECFASGKLQKGQVDLSRVHGSLEICESFIQKAEAVLEVQQHDVSILMSYNSMFHSARALLFKDGLKERSHACLILYLKDKYAQDTELAEYLNSMDAYRRTRHDIQYRGSGCTELDAQEALKDAKGFVEAVSKKLS